MLIGEAIDAVQERYSKRQKSKDSRLSDSLIYSSLIGARSILIGQQSNKNQKISNWVWQTLPCVELIRVDNKGIECVSHNTKCELLRSKHKLPNIVSDIDSDMIIVTTLDGSVNISQTTFETSKYDKGSKYTGNKPRFYIRNSGYLYVTNNSTYKGIPITAVFEDPIEVYRFPSICEDCTECACKSNLDIEFPIDRKLAEALYDIAYEKLIISLLKTKEDKTNNASDDVEPR